jgi:succinate dehydrogenase / fumarate reductase cytochrome b subunit
MTGVRSFYRTSIGKKTVMAVTGLIGVGFVLGHMIGNLQVYLGAETLNAYAKFLKSSMEVLWAIRLVLIAAVVIHVTAAVQLTIENRKARPQRYAYQKPIQASFASRTLRWGGIILLLFIIYHILHFTVGVAPGGPSDFSKTNVYNNVIYGFQNIWVSLFYIAAMLALGMHIYHGAWSLFQSLGLNNARWSRILRRVATALGVILFVGNISIPLMVLAGVLQPQP